MPDPKKFENQRDWMDACMHQLRKVENKEQDESVAQCINIWRDKNKKRARHVVASFLEAIYKKNAGIWVETKKITRLKDTLRSRQQKIVEEPADKDMPFAEKGEMIGELVGGEFVERPFDPVKDKNKDLKKVMIESDA